MAEPEQTARAPRDLMADAQGTLSDTLGMEVVEASAERMVIRMPVERRVQQPVGLLHGGATVALAETVASIGTWLGIDQRRFAAVGLEINCNHLRAVRGGTITAEGLPVHRGRSTWVWDIRIRDDEGRLTAISRCTIAVTPLPGAAPSTAREGA